MHDPKEFLSDFALPFSETRVTQHLREFLLRLAVWASEYGGQFFAHNKRTKESQDRICSAKEIRERTLSLPHSKVLEGYFFCIQSMTNSNVQHLLPQKTKGIPCANEYRIGVIVTRTFAC